METVQQLLIALASACIPVITAFLVTFIKSKTESLKLKSDRDNASKYIDWASDLILEAVEDVSQTYVDALKQSGNFTSESASEAFNLARSKVLNNLTIEAKNAISMVYQDLDQWVDTKIESTIYQRNLESEVLTLVS